VELWIGESELKGEERGSARTVVFLQRRSIPMENGPVQDVCVRNVTPLTSRKI